MPIELMKCVNCGEPLWDNGTVAVHLKLAIYEGKPTVLQTQWCDSSKKTIGETALVSVPTESRPTPTPEDWRQAKEFARSLDPIAYMCPHDCGCLWRDNRDGTMSLFGPSSKSCDKCEFLPLHKLTPLFAAASSSLLPVRPIFCTRGPHQLQKVCPDAFGVPCSPPECLPTRNSEVLADFAKYCRDNPEQRFWQALKNWSGYAFIMASFDGYRVLMPGSSDLRDTYNLEGRRHDKEK